MSTDREVTRIVRSWLEEGATALPDRVLDAVLDQVPATRQRRARWTARRLPQMNTSVRIAVAVVAVVVVALVVVNLMPRTAAVGGPPPTAAPSATGGPTPTPTVGPTLPSGQLAPGTYRADFVTYTLPAGWTSFAGDTILKGNSDPPKGMAVGTWRNIGIVYHDPCHWRTTGGSIGPTVDDLVTALLAQTRSSTATPADVTIDGYSGKQIDLMVPLDVKFDAPSSASLCDDGQYKPWTIPPDGDRYNQGPGQHDLLDILDVNGHTLVIDRVFYPANTAADLAELQAIFDAIRITP